MSADKPTIVKSFIGQEAIDKKEPTSVTEISEQDKPEPKPDAGKGSADSVIKIAELAWKIISSNEITLDVAKSAMAIHSDHPEPFDYHPVSNWECPMYTEFWDFAYTHSTRVQLRLHCSSMARPPGGTPDGYYIPSVGFTVDLLDIGPSDTLSASVNFLRPYISENCFGPDAAGVHYWRPANGIIVPIYVVNLLYEYYPFWIGRRQTLTSTFAIRGDWPLVVYHNKDWNQFTK